MKVRILSGNARGAVVEMGQTEAEANIATGFAEAVAPEAAAPPEEAVVPEAKEPPARPAR